MFDAGGDGWQGANYTVVNSSALRTPHELEAGTATFAAGTLAAGFEAFDFLCLPDGCYEIVVDGGAADSEIGFEFIDEVDVPSFSWSPSRRGTMDL